MTGDFIDPHLDGDLTRRILWGLPSVLGVLGTINEDNSAHLMNISWVIPVANEPVQLVMSIESTSHTRQNLDQRSEMALSLLSLDQRALGRAFVKPDLAHTNDGEIELVAGHRVSRGASGAPFLTDALSVLAGRASVLRDLVDHVTYLVVVDQVSASPVVMDGPASEHRARALGVFDTRMNYGG